MITLFGAPGAGKTEQGRLLSQKYGWKWVGYRELLENLRDKDITFALEHGLFIDDKKATETVAEALKTFQKSGKRLILDGFPSNYKQLLWLIENGEVENLEGAIVLRVPRGELWERLVKRGRVDDTRAAIERRSDEYDRNITGMIKLLRQNEIPVREVSGENSPEDVLARLEDVLSDWNMIPKKTFAKIKL